MADLTTNQEDPRLGWGPNDTPVEQNDAYLVLSAEERAKGFVRPLRDTYKHVGKFPKYPLRPVTPEERERFGDMYDFFEDYPKDGSHGSAIGSYWSQKDLDKHACNGVTSMDRILAETYARNPYFYGSTYCVKCRMHRPVNEFTWVPDGERVGS